MSKIQAHRYHDICAGHRVVGHESKCRHLHGHNYRIHFYCQGEQKRPKQPEFIGDVGVLPSENEIIGLDDLGRVIDFSVIKERLCMWLENEWDHKFLAWKEDTLVTAMSAMVAHLEDGDAVFGCTSNGKQEKENMEGSIVWVPFNPTAENMAHHLLRVVGPAQLEGTGVTLVKVIIEETAKCAVTVEL